jgi:hypothetical protein
MEQNAALREDKPRLSNSFNTYASPEVKQKLGWLVDKASEWAGRDVVLVSSNDLKNYNNPANIKEYGGGIISALQGILPESQQDKITAWKNTTNSNAKAAMNAAALHGAPFATFLERPGPEQKGLCMITLPDMDDTKAFLGKAFAGEDTDTSRMPGDSEDWLAVVIAHEAVHCKMHLTGLAPAVAGTPESLREQFKRSHDQTLKQEIQADQHGFDHYKEAMKDGRDLDPAVLNSFRDLRAIDSIRNGGSIMLGGLGNDHTSNLLLHTHHENDGHGHGHGHMDVNKPETINAITTAQNETTMMAQMAIGMAMGRAYVQSLPEQTLYLRLEGAAAMSMKPGEVSPSVVPKDFDSNPQRAGLLTGYVMAAEKPETLYAATRALQERGAFGEGTLQEAYAKQFIDAIEATAHEKKAPEREALVTFFHESLEKSDGGTKAMEAAVRHNIAQARAPDSPAIENTTLADTAPENKNRANITMAPQM